MIRHACLACAALLALTAAAQAQDRSPTGRHRPAPVAAVEPAPAPGGGASAWTLALGGGVVLGGDLLRVETLDGLPAPWSADNGGGFRSARFLTSLEPGAGVTLGLARRLGERWSLRLDMAWSRQDVAAEADFAQEGAVYLFDRFSVLHAGLGAEARLTDRASHPYAGFGLVLVSLRPDAAQDLAQTNLGARVCAGWRQRLDRNLSLRLEAFGALSRFSAGAWEPRADLVTQPPVAVQASDRLTTYGLLLSLATRL